MHPPPADLSPQLLFCGHTIADKWLPIKIVFCSQSLLSTPLAKMKPLFSFKAFQAKGYRFCVILLICIIYYILYYYWLPMACMNLDEITRQSLQWYAVRSFCPMFEKMRRYWLHYICNLKQCFILIIFLPNQLLYSGLIAFQKQRNEQMEKLQEKWVNV